MKSIFTRALDYLSGKKELLTVLEQQSTVIKLLKESVEAKQEVIKEEKPCKNKIIYNVNTKYVNVITCENNSYAGYDISPETVELLKDAEDAIIIQLLSPKKEEVIVNETEGKIEKEEKELVSHFLDIFDGVDDFEVVGDSVYFKGIKSVEIPSVIVARFIEILENGKSVYGSIMTEMTDEYQSLKAFTAKLLTSPREESIQQVLKFCRHNDMRISKRGNIIAYRRVREYTDVSMPDNLELVAFVKESIDKVKKWKKSPKNYEIYTSDDFEGYDIIETSKIYQKSFQDRNHSIIGNLFDLYNNQSVLKPETTKLYSSQHDYGKYQFAIGDVYKADENDIDVDAGQCHSGGLHFASVNYNYTGYGEIPVVVLINPAKTITIPLNELAKGRTTEMKIACVNPNEHGVHIDEALIEQADEEYDEYTLEELQQVISQKTLKPLSVEEEVTVLSIPEVVNIREILSRRVISI